MKYLLNLKKILIFILVYNSSTNLIAQSKQSIQFFVNSYRFIDTEYNKDLEPLCEGFYVTINTDKINIGDEYDLTITKSEFDSEKKVTEYWVEDKAKQDKICRIFLGKDNNGENLIQIHSCSSIGEVVSKGGIQFRYWDYTSNYDLWRHMRNKE